MSKAYVDDHRIMLDDKDITNFCKDVTLTDDLQALAVELTFTVFVSEWDKYVKKLGIEPGAKMKVVNHDNIIFTGLVVSVSLDGAVTAYDRGWYLNKSQIIFQCTNPNLAAMMLRLLTAEKTSNSPRRFPSSLEW